MYHPEVLLALVVICGLVQGGQLAPLHERTAESILGSTATWRMGDPIPEEFKHLRSAGGCFPAPTDTTALIGQITNDAFLAELIASPDVEEPVAELALAQALEAIGPNRIFGLLRERLHTVRAQTAWEQEWRSALARRFVVVDSLYIRDGEMNRQEAEQVLDRIEASLRSGAEWGAVLSRYSSEFEYADHSRTKIGNLGHFAVAADTRLVGRYVEDAPGVVYIHADGVPEYLGHIVWIDPAHRDVIIKANEGALIRLYSEQMKALVLYEVREVYEPADGRRAATSDSAPNSR